MWGTSKSGYLRYRDTFRRPFGILKWADGRDFNGKLLNIHQRVRHLYEGERF
jgi:hypothetical protein